MILFISQAERIIKLAEVLTISAVKFLIAPLYSLGIGYSYLQTILYTTMGGVLGIFFFFYLSGWIIDIYNKVMPFIKCQASKFIIPRPRIKIKRTFSFKNKLLAKMKTKYGYTGIIILTPILLSIPLGSFLAKKYYSEKKNVLMHLALSVFAWTFVLSTFFALI
jgi:hypothetical protein